MCCISMRMTAAGLARQALNGKSPSLTLLWHFRSVLPNPPVAVGATIRDRRRSEQLGDDGAADLRQRWLWRRSVGYHFFSPTRRLQAPVLQIGKGNAGHQRVPMQAGPGPAFEVTEPELLLELLVHLLAGPACLDAGGQLPQRGPLRPVAEVVLLLAAVAPFADQPELRARQAGALGVARP